METAINLVLPLLEGMLPLFTKGLATTGTAATVIKGLEAVVPVLPTIGRLADDVIPKVKNIINVVSDSTVVTDDQAEALDKLDAASDAAFDSALAAAEAEDAKQSSS